MYFAHISLSSESATCAIPTPDPITIKHIPKLVIEQTMNFNIITLYSQDKLTVNRNCRAAYGS